MMQLQAWLAEFCRMHERAHHGSLSGEEQAEYLAARDELARAVLKTQRIVLKPGQQPRRTLRAALAMQLVLQIPSGRVQTLTQDLSSGGFSTLLATSLAPGQIVPFLLRLSREGPPVDGNAKVVATQAGTAGMRVSFSFDALAPESVERIELAVFDSLVAQLTAQG